MIDYRFESFFKDRSSLSSTGASKQESLEVSIDPLIDSDWLIGDRISTINRGLIVIALGWPILKQNSPLNLRPHRSFQMCLVG
ncbi:hypothetical protein MJO28_001773 [Puccinia striiformis f. sp. tritici]|uniref:Uncharacterized protein n=4 Tax=Puccinia striiformis f. sp. tritici TaxID=168172 RepID=A0ACC0DSP1_9BASI|nr:hypothetical protein MJO28_017042 [Puccinia striiformis f. sp. tritici]KAI7936615.1 hypothetical protein MJO28_015514 [Puccinia striiformis f. sp. tritici]KAI7938537.1 hypothetical protein MJO28_015457 [Puccinia striiformis f. sp. tritici]KAI7938538.1 hypothetical protein MJO28_015458 [Puccinia striiformis f. sp. tritici]KAI7961284.1 hypothetical protein MJO28_001773 [Puccinia striiformis f. sp. tritici]